MRYTFESRILEVVVHTGSFANEILSERKYQLEARKLQSVPLAISCTHQAVHVVQSLKLKYVTSPKGIWPPGRFDRSEAKSLKFILGQTARLDCGFVSVSQRLLPATAPSRRTYPSINLAMPYRVHR